MFSLEGKVVVVVGGAGGVGSAVCRGCAEQGAAVAVVYRTSDAAARTLVAALHAHGKPAVAIQADVTDPDQVDRMVRDVLERLGSIDVLVCSQGGGYEMQPFLAQPTAEMQRIMSTLYWSVVHVTRAVLPHMLARGSGRLIVVGSDAGKIGTAYQAVASAARGAVMSFFKSLAREYGRKGLLFNVVCAGPTDTGAWRGRVEAGGFSARILEALLRAVPLRRIARPEEVAAAVVFLASADASFVTGQALSVTGGMTMC